MRILAIHAHPDDLEILAAGTLARLARLGHSITFATMTPGDCGTAEYDPETIAKMRREEARDSAAMIGADLCLRRISRSWRSSTTTPLADGSPN